MICIPDLWGSQILVYFNPQSNPLFIKLFQRNKEENEQELIPLKNKSLIKQRSWLVPNDVLEKSYLWKIYDDNKLVYQTKVWFYGAFNNTAG